MVGKLALQPLLERGSYQSGEAFTCFFGPEDAQRLAYGAQYHDAARRVLEIEEPPPGDARLDQLLAARHRAEFADVPV